MFKNRVVKTVTGKREEKKEVLRQALVKAAGHRISKLGLGGLRARDIAKDAGCALGSLYTVFTDIDELILHVNSNTLSKLGVVMEAAARRVDSPQDVLVALANEYLKFATENRNIWAALFDHRIPEGADEPEWHVAEHLVLMRWITIPLARLLPTLNENQLAVQARILFAAVHGIVSIGLHGHFVAVPRRDLESQLTQFIKRIIVGYQSSTNKVDNTDLENE